MTDNQDLSKQLDKYLEESLYYYDLPGLCFSVVKEDFSYVEAAGYSNYETKVPLHRGDVFHMASVGKLFTGTAILILVEKGQLSLEDRVIDVLPWFSVDDDKVGEIKIKHMLSHTSGMGNVSDYRWHDPETDEGALKRYCQSDQVKKAKMIWSPEENKFSYSDMAYEVLGCIINEISKQTFEDFIRDNIFIPLEMSNSTFLTFQRDVESLVRPHRKNKENHIFVEEYYPYNRAHGPSSTLTTDGFDIQKWGLAHVHRKILKPETYKLAWTAVTEVPNNAETMGLSWFMRNQKGCRILGHEGSDDGFRSSFWICPEKETVITVMTNVTKAPIKRLNKGIFNMLIG